MIVFPVISRLYSPEEFGLLALLFSIHTIALLFATGQFELAIVLPKKDENALKLIRVGLVISFVVSSLFLIFSIIFQKIYQEYSSTPNIYIWLIPLTLTILTTAFSSLIIGYCNRKKLYRHIIGYNIILSTLTVTLKVVFGVLKVNNGLVLGFLIAQTITNGYFLLIPFSNHLSLKSLTLITKQDFILTNKYLNFPKFNLPLNFINTFSTNLPFFLIAAYFSKSLTGQLSIALTLLFKITTLYSNSAAQVLYQRIAFIRHEGKKIWPIIKNYMARTLIPSIVFIVLFIIFAPSVFCFVLGKEWYIAARFSQIMAPWALLVLLGGPLSFIPNIFEKQRTNLVICTVNLIFRALGLYIGIYLNNVYIAVGLFAFSSLLAITYQLIWYKKLIFKYDKEIE